MTDNGTDAKIRGLSMPEELFTELLAELAQRGAGYRESGAFLLSERLPTTDPCGPLTIVAIAYYDDLDSNCLTGGITFGAAGYTALNARCRRDSLLVVGDMHTHPRNHVVQSDLDASHPMAALDGHVALIAPNYAEGPIGLEDLGAHVFHPDGWTSYLGPYVATVLTLIPTTHQSPKLWWVRTLIARLSSTLRRRRTS